MDDGKQGQGLRIACETRKAELQLALAALDKGDESTTRKDIEAALDALSDLLTGDLDHIPRMVSEQMSRWLESSKYLGLKEQREIDARPR